MLTIHDDYPASTGNYSLGRGGYQVEWITIHYTGTDASAENNAIYFSRSGAKASAHYFIDGLGIWASVPEQDTAWHCGNFHANEQSIGIEVVSAGELFGLVEIERLQALVLQLMAKYGIDADHVVRHYDMKDVCDDGTKWVDPHKACPLPYTPAGGDTTGGLWMGLHSLITDGSRAVRAYMDKLSGEAVAQTPAVRGDVSDQLVVDGYWGCATTRALQDHYGTVADGEVWHQWKPTVDSNPGLTSGWCCDGSREGSPLIRAIQQDLNSHGWQLNVDGVLGPLTICAMQREVGAGAADCVLSGPSPCIAEMQRRLNAGEPLL